MPPEGPAHSLAFRCRSLRQRSRAGMRTSLDRPILDLENSRARSTTGREAVNLSELPSRDRTMADKSSARLSLSETKSCWHLISKRAMLTPYARGFWLNLVGIDGVIA